MILAHHGKTPDVSQALYVAPNATIVGEVEIGADCSFWFNCVVRGDVNWIRIGRGSNVQDHSMLHVTYQKAPLVIGDDVTIGHACTVHGCTVGNRVLIGMGSVLMDHVVVEDDCIIGAGSLLTQGTHVPRGSMVYGKPAKVQRALTNEEIAHVRDIAERYRHVARSYVGGPWPVPGLR